MKAVSTEHPGHMLSLGSYTFLLSENPDVKWKNMSVVDFVGDSKYEFNGSYTDNTPDKKKTTFTLYLLDGANKSAYLFSGWTGAGTGTYEENDGHFTIHMSYEENGQKKNYDSTSSTQGGKEMINVKAAFKVQRGPTSSWETISCDVEKTK